MAQTRNYTAARIAGKTIVALAQVGWTACKYGGAGLVLGLEESAGFHTSNAQGNGIIMAPAIARGLGTFAMCLFAKSAYNYRARQARETDDIGANLKPIFEDVAMRMATGKGMQDALEDLRYNAGAKAVKSMIFPTISNAVGYYAGRAIGRAIA